MENIEMLEKMIKEGKVVDLVIEDFQFKGRNLSDLVFDRCTFKNVLFDTNAASHLKFSNCNFIGSDFCANAFTEIEFRKSQFGKCYFEKNLLCGLAELAYFGKCFFKDNAIGVNIEETSLTECWLNGDLFFPMVIGSWGAIVDTELKGCKGIENVERGSESYITNVTKC